MNDQHRQSTRTCGIRLASLVIVLAAAGCASTTSQPTAERDEYAGYAMSSGSVVRSGSGECVRAGYWDPSYANQECDPSLVAKAAPPPEKPPEPTAVAPAPEPEAAPQEEVETEAAQAEPEPLPAVAPPQPVRVYVGADAFFGFDKAELTPQAKQALDRIIERARNAEEATVTIIGHADRIGPTGYNDALSQRRARTVENYLLEQGMPESAVSMSARGEGDPVVACEGRRGDSLIECLQPNRRTEIELSALESVEEQ